MNGGRRTGKRIVGVAAVLLGMVLLLIGSFTYVTRYRITDIDSTVSPDGEYELRYQNVGEPDFPFGYAHARLVLRRGRKTIVERSFDVANDGAAPAAEQWAADWKDDRVEVVISGEEQPDHLYTLFYNGTSAWKEPAVGPAD